MKQEFKKGDRVWVRNSDLQEWIQAVFVEITDDKYKNLPFRVEIGVYEYCYPQCRHIDEK
jgi:hypothetical protein